MGRNFSLDGFKKFISEQDETLSNFFDVKEEENSLVGKQVFSKVSSKKLLEKIDAEQGKPETLVNDFIENGGTINDTKDKTLLIEVNSGVFYIPRFFVKF
jgi:hypothetical protein